VTCHNCRTECRKFGKRGNRQRYQCNQCRRAFTVILWYTRYNFGRVHESLRCTLAMEAGIADHVWTVREML
jgi:transposase-like protein